MGKDPDTSAPVRTVRHMDQIGAEDIAVGQVWFHSITHAQERGHYRVVGIDEDRVTLARLRGNRSSTSSIEVTFASLLSMWVLAVEAPAESAVA